MGTDDPCAAAEWTKAELVLITALYKRLAGRGCAPVLCMMLNADRVPVAAFNSAFTSTEADLIGAVIQSVLEHLPTR